MKKVDGRTRQLGTSNDERSERTRGELLLAAAEAFDRRGYLDTSMNDITDRLGLTKGALYFHYPSKEALAVAVVEAHYDRWDPVAASVVGTGASRLDELVTLSYKVAEAFQRDVIVRAGVRLQAERDLISAAMPQPYVEWIKRDFGSAQLRHERWPPGSTTRPRNTQPRNRKGRLATPVLSVLDEAANTVRDPILAVLSHPKAAR